jgi:hypothetical protein
MWPNRFGFADVENLAHARKAPEFCAVVGEHGAKLRSLSWWREFRLQSTEHQPKRINMAADLSATAGIIFRNFLSGKRRMKEVKRFNVTHGFLKCMVVSADAIRSHEIIPFRPVGSTCNPLILLEKH